MKALLSTYDKKGIEVFASGLKKLGIDIVATSGTNKHLLGHEIETSSTASMTGFEELLDGKIKTLHPDIHYMIATGQFGILAVNLIPISEEENPLESMDIGGVSLIRSGVKNWENVCVVTNPEMYDDIMKELRAGEISRKTKLKCALEAIKVVMAYDWNILEVLKKIGS